MNSVSEVHWTPDDRFVAAHGVWIPPPVSPQRAAEVRRLTRRRNVSAQRRRYKQRKRRSR